MARTRSRMQKNPPLPQEILHEILLRASPKTLITCTCVCKEWYSLIKSPTFITSHSKHQLKTKLLFLAERNKDSYFLLSGNGAAFTRLEYTEIPFKVDPLNCSITSRNGLHCVDLSIDFNRHIFLWNPSVRRFRSVDVICFDSTNMYCPEDYIYALGLDEFHNEYKVVKIYGKPAKADVYCLSTNSWHTTLVGNNKDIISTIPHTRKHAHVNGAIHWLAYFRKRANHLFLHSSDLAIFSFDFSTELLRDLSLPIKWHDKINSNFQHLTALKGMLSFLVSCNSLCYVWLMKEYGVAKSWTKAYTIVPGTRFYQPLGFTNTRLVYYSFDGRRLMSYDLDSNISTDVSFQKSVVTQVFFDFRENLILLDQGSASMEQAMQDYRRTL